MRRTIMLLLLFFGCFVGTARGQTSVISLTVTSSPTNIVINQACNYVVIQENSASPTNAFTITLPGSATGITYAAGTKFIFTANQGGFLRGQTIGSISIATGSVGFIGIESIAAPTLPQKLSTGGGAGNPASPQGALQLANAAVSGFATATCNGALLAVDNVNAPTTLLEPCSFAVGGPRPYYDVTAPQYLASGSLQTTTGTISSGSHTLALGSNLDFANGEGIAVYQAGPNPSISAPTGLAISQSTNIPYIDFAANPIGLGLSIAGGATCSGTTATITTVGYHGLATGESVTVAGVANSSGSPLSAYNITATITVTNTSQFTYTIGSCPGTGGSYNVSNLATITLNAGSLTYNYEMAAIDAFNGVTAVSSSVALTSTNPPYGGFQVYNTLTATRVSGATMYAVYRKIGAGSYSCVGVAEQPGPTSASVTYLDFGFSSRCPTNVPSSPPSSAVPQILVTTISSGAGTTSLTLAATAGNNASGTVQHDDTAAINGAIAAAAAESINYCGGGIVKIPGPNTYYVQTLVFPATTPNASCSMIVQLGGRLIPRQPILFQDVNGYDLIGDIGGPAGPGQGANTMAYIDGFTMNIAPVIGIRNSSSIRIKNITSLNFIGDGILVDGDSTGLYANNLFYDNVQLQESSTGSGFAYHCAGYGAGSTFAAYSQHFSNSLFIDNAGLGKPSQYADNCALGWSTWETVNWIGGGVYLKGSNPGPDIGKLFINAVTEAIPTAVIRVDTSNEDSTGVDIESISASDVPNGGDPFLLEVLPLNGARPLTGPKVHPAYGSYLLEGLASDFDLRCMDDTGDCNATLVAPYTNWLFAGSGTYRDNRGQQFTFANPNSSSYAGQIIVGGLGYASEVINPAGAILSSTSGQTGYHDELEQSAPSNPPSGYERWFANSSSHLFSCLTSGGASCNGGSGGGVSSFSSGNLTPLFTTSVATATTTPALTFSLSNAAQNSVFAGPPSGGAGAPSYQTAPTFSAANLTSFPTFNQNTTGTAANLSGSQTANYFYAAPNGSSGTASFRAIVGADIPTLNQSTTGSAAKWTTARNLAGNSVDGSANVAFANKFIVQGTTDSGLSGAQFLGALSTGILKNTTTTGVLSIAAASDVYGLWSGTCNSGTYLSGSGACSVPSGSNPMTTLGDVIYGGASGAETRLAGPTGPNSVVQFLVDVPSAGAAVAESFALAGIVPRASTCTSNLDTIVATDRTGYVSWSDASACAVTLPQAGSTGFASNFVMAGCDIGAGTATITPTTSTISYANGNSYTSAASSVAVTTGECITIYSDNSNYFAVLYQNKILGSPTATTQSVCDNSTKVATTAYAGEVCNNVEASGSPLSATAQSQTIWNNTASAYVVDLPTPTASGPQICLGNYKARTSAISFVPGTGVTIYYKGVAGTSGSSTGLVSGGAAGDFICVEGTDSTTYEAIGAGQGTFTNN